MSEQAVQQYLADFEAMVAQAKLTKPSAGRQNFGRIAYSAGATDFTMADGTPAIIDIPSTDTGSIRLLSLNGAWRETKVDGDTVGVGFVVEVGLALLGERITIMPGDKQLLLPGYGADDEAANAAFEVWRDRAHTIRGRVWLADPTEADLKPLETLQELLVGEHGFTVEEQPRWFDRTERKWKERNQLFSLSPPAVPRDADGEPMWEVRGAPVTSFELTNNQPDPADPKDGERFKDLATGSLQAQRQFLVANSENVDLAAQGRARGVMYGLTGFTETARDGTVRAYAREARMGTLVVGAETIRFGGGSDAVQTGASILASRPAITVQPTGPAPDAESDKTGDFPSMDAVMAAAHQAATESTT